MRANDNYNIITGEYKPQVSSATHNRRFTSLDVLRKMKECGREKKNEDAPNGHARRLGTPQDSKLYQYSYVSKGQAQTKPLSSKPNDEKADMGVKRSSEPVSLMNASKLNYNFINHTVDTSNAKWEVTKKSAPVSKFTDLGRINAPNYTETYKEQAKFGKKMALCNTVCEIQRSYGTDKFFRKFK